MNKEDQKYLYSMHLSLKTYDGTDVMAEEFMEHIRQLPGFISPTKTHRFGAESPLKLEHACEMEHEGRKFMSAEHAVHYEKAVHFVDRIAAERIGELRDISHVRELSAGIKHYYSPGLDDVWMGLLLRVNRSKFASSLGLRHLLLETSGGILVEDQPADRYASVSIADEFEADDEENTNDFVTEFNALGIALTRLRGEFSRKF